MNRLISFILVFILTGNIILPAYSANGKIKQITKIEKKGTVPDVSFGSEESPMAAQQAPVQEVLIPVNVKNLFDKEIKVKFDTNREYPIGPNETITLGQRKPGRYTLTVLNKNGDFVDNLTQNIDNRNKFVLNENTVSNSNKITGLSTGQKVAITAGALGAATIGGVLLNMALQENSQTTPQADYFPPAQNLPATPETVAPAIPSQPSPEYPAPTDDSQIAVNPPSLPQDNAFAPGGKGFKFLNNLYSQATLIIEGSDGSPIGNNWSIPKGALDQKAQPLIYSGEKIKINPNQKVKVLIPGGFELQRYAFELESDPVDGSYVWVLK